MTAWWAHFAQGKSMHTLVLRRRGAVEGIVPLVLSFGWEAFPTRGKYVTMAEDYRYLPAMRWRRFVPIRRLSFPLGFPSSSIRSHLLLRQAEAGLVAAVLSYCQSIRHRWDVLSLEGIPQGSEQESLLCALAPKLGLRQGRSRHSRSFLSTPLPDSMAAFLAERSHNFRRGLRRARRQGRERTAVRGELAVREYRGDSIEAGMARLLDLEGQSWKVKKARKREHHLTLNDESSRFHRRLAKAFALSDEAQVLVTEVGERPANALYSLERQGVITCVLTYQAEELASEVSVAPLWGRFFEIAIERGLRQVDFNGDNSYLARYAKTRSHFDRLVFYNDGFVSSLLRLAADGAHLVARAAGTRGGGVKRAACSPPAS